MNSLGHPKTWATVMASAVLGAGAAFGASACGEERGGDVEVQPGTETGKTGTGGAGGASTGKTETGGGTSTGQTGTGGTSTGQTGTGGGTSTGGSGGY